MTVSIGVSRRTFLVGAGSALVVGACADDPDTMAGDAGADSGLLPSDGGAPMLDGGGETDAGVQTRWQLEPGHYASYFPLHVVYPRPDDETGDYARHRHAYPGVLYEIPIGVQFGAWPYRYELVEGPPGARIVEETLRWNGVDAFDVPEGYGVLAWTPPADAAPGPHRFRVRVYDQDHERPSPSFVDVEWTTAVGTSQFVFLDTLRGDDATADGTIERPFREISALLASGLGALKIVYVRQTALFDPDDSRFAGGYVPSPPAQFAYGAETAPRAYVAYPGETVHVNAASQDGFAQSNGVNHDVFFDRIVVGFTHQAIRTLRNVRVIMNWNKARRSTFWRMGCIRAYGGTVKDDNHGFIWYWNDGGSVEDETGHVYLYSADCWMDRMNVDPGPDAVFEGRGGNGPHLWETYTTNRTLAERHRVTNSDIINNGFIIIKGSGRDGEIRACVTNEGNTGSYHVRVVGSAGTGETQRVVLCYNKTGGTDGAVTMGQAGSDPPYRDVISYRNSCVGVIRAATNPEALSAAYDNIARSVTDDVTTASGNIEHGGDVASVFDENLNLVGAARAAHLGTKGAEIA